MPGEAVPIVGPVLVLNEDVFVDQAARLVPDWYARGDRVTVDAAPFVGG